jgi:hypothetical protein
MTIDPNVIIASMTNDPETISECAAEFVLIAQADVQAIVAAAAAEGARCNSPVL